MKLDTKTIIIIAIVALILYNYWRKSKEHFKQQVPAGPNNDTWHQFCSNTYGDKTPDYYGCMRQRGAASPLSKNDPMIN